MDKEKLYSDIKLAVQRTVADADSKLLDAMNTYSDRISKAIIDYVAIPDPAKGQNGFAIVVKDGVYVLEQCCHTDVVTIPNLTNTSQEGTQTTIPSIPVIAGQVVFSTPVKAPTMEADEGSFDVMNLTNGLSLMSSDGTKSEVTSEEGSLYNNGEPVSSTQISFSAAQEEGLQDCFLQVGASPYMINTIKGKVNQVEIGYTLNALLKAPRKLEIIAVVEDIEYPLYTMTENNDPDDFVKAMQRVSLTPQDFGQIPVAKGDLIKVQFKQGQYEITDISVSLNIGG